MARTGVRIDSGRAFMGSARGAWAGERMMAEIQAGRPLTPACLRTYATLRKDEWIFLDEQLVEEATIRLVGVGDLINAGLVRPVPDSMGQTVFQYEKATDMDEATVSMDGMVRSEDDAQEFSLASVPLPITHKDFFINLRTLQASRNRGEPLDSLQVRTAGRLVSEKLEQLLFQGGKVYGGSTIYGYTTHPDRNVAAFGTNGNWATTNAAKTGENILADVQTLMTAAEADRFYGPYWLYVPRNSSVKLDGDFKSNSDKTIRQRLLEIEAIAAVRTADQLLANNVVLVQATLDVAAWVQGEQLQSVQWDVSGGFGVNFKAFQIGVPLVRSTSDGRSGVQHMS